MIANFLTSVAEFHAVMKYRTPEPTIPDFSDEATNTLRPSLLREEIHELRQAIAENNRVEQLDALCDIQYVLSGAVLAWGLRSFFKESTMTTQLRKIQDMDEYLARMFGAVDMIEVSAKQQFGHSVALNLRALQSHLTRGVWSMGFIEVFREAFDTVHLNNMGKIWSQMDKDYHLSCEQFGNELLFEETIGGYIARRMDGKIIKPSSFQKVSLERFV